MEETVKLLKIEYPHLFITHHTDNSLKFEKESDTGFVEYKRTLTNCCDIKIQKYATQMRWRITENRKQIATYYIGLDDDGTIIGVPYDEIRLCTDNFIKISYIIKASVINIHLLKIYDKTVLKIKVKIKKRINDEYLEF